MATLIKKKAVKKTAKGGSVPIGFITGKPMTIGPFASAVAAFLNKLYEDFPEASDRALTEPEAVLIRRAFAHLLRRYVKGITITERWVWTDISELIFYEVKKPNKKELKALIAKAYEGKGEP